MDKELYIIRHGETELNRLGIVQGRGIDSDLNDTGRAQAEAFYEMYKKVPFDKIYTSKLKRTHQTVNKFIQSGIQWEQLSGLDELAWGEWEGKQNSELAISVFRMLIERWQGGDYDAKFASGESPAEVATRLLKAMDHIKSKSEEKLVLVCMHGRAMRLLLCLLTDKPLSEMGDFPHLNTTLYKVTLNNDRFTITDFNNTNHLKEFNNLGKN